MDRVAAAQSVNRAIIEHLEMVGESKATLLERRGMLPDSSHDIRQKGKVAVGVREMRGMVPDSSHAIRQKGEMAIGVRQMRGILPDSSHDFRQKGKVAGGWAIQARNPALLGENERLSFRGKIPKAFAERHSDVLDHFQGGLRRTGLQVRERSSIHPNLVGECGSGQTCLKPQSLNPVSDAARSFGCPIRQMGAKFRVRDSANTIPGDFEGAFATRYFEHVTGRTDS